TAVGIGVFWGTMLGGMGFFSVSPGGGVGKDHVYVFSLVPLGGGLVLFYLILSGFFLKVLGVLSTTRNPVIFSMGAVSVC
ncbi:hypothetical protein Q2330_26840, partial [Escherichia coli]|nr:hypothetical protein [Escherichia coli]